MHEASALAHRPSWPESQRAGVVAAAGATRVARRLDAARTHTLEPELCRCAVNVWAEIFIQQHVDDTDRSVPDRGAAWLQMVSEV
eukprot:5457723-Prymnesium_polylepis.4